MQRTFSFALAVLLLGLADCRLLAADKVDLENLLPQMTDLSRLAEFPDPPYVIKQFSSYDRASEVPGRASWFANGDRGFMLYDGVLKEETPYFRSIPKAGASAEGRFTAGTRVGIAPTHKRSGGYVWVYVTGADGRPIEGKTPQGYIAQSAIAMDEQGHVLAEMDGPGCVVRIWSANPKDAGKIRIYLDGAEKPAIEAPLEALLAGKWKTTIEGTETTPFPDPLACERSRGFNLYFPIAYARHCKITIDRPDIYYHVDYRTYPTGTVIQTFSMDVLGKTSHLLHNVLETLRLERARVVVGLGHALGEGASWTMQERKLAPGQSSRFAFSGSQAITRLCATVDADSASDDPEAWRGLLLKANFDGAPMDQICCPLGDFFASSPGFNPYDSAPFDVGKPETPRQMWAWWSMPFQNSARQQVINMGKKTVTVSLKMLLEPHTWTDRSMHFHAKWRAETLKTRPFRDWTYCDLTGKGVFVGDMLSIANPVPAWWGEGDEKIFVDGESFPSWFGTGSEDYYGYAWSDPKPFQHPYHNQTRCDGPGNRGRTSVNRFHVLDAIPFTKSFRFDMEFWHWTPNIDVGYASTSYWYARPGATDDFKEPDALAIQTLPSLPPPYRIKGALEGEKLKVVNKSGDFDVGPQEMTPFADGKWSGDSHLWVRPAKSGEWVDLELPVAADRRYHVFVYLTKARDYGVVRFQLNGKSLGRAVDCFNADNVVSTGAIDLGTADLQKGTARLRVEVIGSNPSSVGLRYMWGLDCVVLKPAG
jgi:hypothetical protein